MDRTATVADIKKKKDGYYFPVYAQGGGTRVFWSFAGKTLAEAKKRVKSAGAPTKNEPLKPAVRKRVWGAIEAYRKQDAARFNKTPGIAFYTDHAYRFSGANKNNPTAELLDACGLRYGFVNTEQILAGELDGYRVLFCPGGFGYFPNKKMAETMRSFVKQGGGFIGLCAGAFLPLKDFLGLCDSTYAYFREQGFPDVLLNPRDPVAKGCERSVPPVTYALSKKTPSQRKCTIRIKMFRANGPLLVAQGRDKAVGYFDSTEDYAPVIRSTYGKGRVVSFSTHPDCSMRVMLEQTSEQNVLENAKLFKNAVLWCGRA